MGPGSSISRRQNARDAISLLRAVAVAHQRAQRGQTVGLLVSVVLAVLGVLAALRPSTAPVITLLGAVWAVAYAVVLVPVSSRGMRLAAVLQEMFDVHVLQLPWNPVVAGEPVPVTEVSRLSRRFRGDEGRLRDYYLVPRLPYPDDVFFCIEQNLAWGPRVRRRYAYTVIAAAACWCLAGVVVSFALRMTVPDLVSNWFVPSLGLLLFCLDVYRAQVTVSVERERVLDLLRARQDGPPGSRPGAPERLALARQVQDAVFFSRQQQPHVPTWFFRVFHDSDRTDFEAAMRRMESGSQQSAPEVGKPS